MIQYYKIRYSDGDVDEISGREQAFPLAKVMCDRRKVTCVIYRITEDGEELCVVGEGGWDAEKGKAVLQKVTMPKDVLRRVDSERMQELNKERAGSG